MKTVATCFSVRANGENGRFYLREGKEKANDSEYYWCELTCNTSFGVVGHYWGSMGSPAAEFLRSCDAGYVGGKLWGANSRVLDWEATRDHVKEVILRKMYDGELDEEDAKEASDHLDTSCATDAEWYVLAVSNDIVHGLMCSMEAETQKCNNPAMDGFFKTLWPAFIAELTAANDDCPGCRETLDGTVICCQEAP